MWRLFLLYPVGVIPFTYVSSFIFQSENVAQTVTIFVHFVFAGIGAIATYIMRIIASTMAIGDKLNWILKICPSFCLTNSIMFSSSRDSLFSVRPDLQAPDLSTSLMGGDILLLCMHFCFWIIVLIMIEAGAFNFIRNCLHMLKKNRIPPRTDLEFDEDVLEEERRIADADPKSMQVRVNRFRKVYPSLFRTPVVGVERTSFGLDYGECFALLGVNGAGKTTTFKSLTYEIVPTAGSIEINGFDVRRNFSKVRKLIGYCPQHDAIFDLMTVEEHLDYYARIKGIPRRLRSSIIEKQIKEMNLSEHRKKTAG